MIYLRVVSHQYLGLVTGVLFHFSVLLVGECVCVSWERAYLFIIYQGRAGHFFIEYKTRVHKCICTVHITDHYSKIQKKIIPI